MALSNSELDEIQARAEAATEGPWFYTDQIGDGHNVTRNSWDVATCYAGDLDPEDGSRDEQAARNAVFVSHAREDIDNLIAEVRRLRQYAYPSPSGTGF